MTPTSQPQGAWASGATVLGKYELLHGVGCGTFSVVYAAREQGTNRVVALKRITSGSRPTPTALEHVRREITRIQDIRHPGIVPVHGFLVEGDDGVMISEFAPGQSLADRLRQRGALSVDQVVTLGIALAGTLVEVHRAGIIHRGIKPENVMLGQLAGPRLTDFSGTSPDDREGDRTAGPGADRCLPYAAPELKAGAPGDARTDVYGLGLTLYVALVSELPSGTAPGQVPVALPFGFHPCQSARGSSIPRHLDDVIARATCASPADRFPGPRGLALALEPLVCRQAAAGDLLPGEGTAQPRSGGVGPFPEALSSLT